MKFSIPSPGDKFVIDTPIKLECVVKIKRQKTKYRYSSNRYISHVKSIDFNKGDSIIFCNVNSSPISVVLVRLDKSIEKIGLQFCDLDKLSVTLSEKNVETNVTVIKQTLDGTGPAARQRKLRLKQSAAIKEAFFYALKNSCDQNVFLRASCYDMMHLINEKFKKQYFDNRKRIEKFEDLFNPHFWNAYSKLKNDNAFKVTMTFNRVKDCKWLCEGTIDESMNVEIMTLLPMPPRNKNVQ